MHSLIHLHLSHADVDAPAQRHHITDAYQSLLHLGPILDAALVFNEPQTMRLLAMRLEFAADAMDAARADRTPAP